jgi:aspartate-semialdehyde dehydrogenase
LSNLYLTVSVKFRKHPSKEELINALRSFEGEPQKLNLPSAPKHFIQYLDDDDRPQIQKDVNYEHGMGISVGRLRKDSLFDYKFVGLVHNTIRGAAGGGILTAELLVQQGYLNHK